MKVFKMLTSIQNIKNIKNARKIKKSEQEYNKNYTKKYDTLMKICERN